MPDRVLAQEIQHRGREFQGQRVLQHRFQVLRFRDLGRFDIDDFFVGGLRIQLVGVQLVVIQLDVIRLVGRQRLLNLSQVQRVQSARPSTVTAVRSE